MLPNIFPALVSAAVFLLCSAQVIAQQPEPSTSGGVHLELACAASQCRFRQGEVIAVNLTFRADLLGYGVMIGYPARFEMGEQDRFSVNPAEGVSDPVGDAASSWVEAGSRKVGLEHLDPMSGHGTAKIRLEANQWLYFQKPGNYSIQAISKRLCTLDWDCLELSSNPLEIQIVAADPEWQRRELDRIVRALPATLGPLTESERATVWALTYFGTDEALREIEKRLAGDGSATDLSWRFARRFLIERTARPRAW